MDGKHKEQDFTYPLNCCSAASTSAFVDIVTKPNPLLLPVSLSYITCKIVTNFSTSLSSKTILEIPLYPTIQ